ncbi:MAG: AmmeMemoRadiSam system protein B [Spirochaetes bacterium]|uniref:AmmeMemoRadiSam system protein B n=1 Tax=Candidatus Ornithospirochaeta stercoripullorum TaxID=2840899 RepID=A0A9D9DYH1_9SPIO|nr:AmmeMemoRadiSam system protein B [Candidatus Ornithospirochaeta stercoripullorum]
MIYHNAIFYPDTEEELKNLVLPINDKESHKAFILPHMRLASIASLYRDAFSSIPNGKRIVAILPLHRETLEKDQGKFIFSPRKRGEETLLGPVQIESLSENDSKSYEEEEYSLELLYPYVACHNPDSILCPLFVSIKNAEEMKRLSSFIASLDDGNTTFIVSSNMTGRMMGKNTAEDRDSMISLLESKSHLMDLWQRGKITACGAPAIEAVQRVITSAWHLIGLSDDESITGHAAFYAD